MRLELLNLVLGGAFAAVWVLVGSILLCRPARGEGLPSSRGGF